MEVKEKRIWALFIFVIVIAFLASGIWENPISKIAKNAVGDVQKYWTTPTIQPDVAILTQDEACALVYNYLEARASSITTVNIRLNLLTTLSKARPYFTATYQGNGKWQVSALGYGPTEKSNDWFFYYPGGLWNLYEALKTIEPANNQATALLIYIQRYTK